MVDSFSSTDYLLESSELPIRDESLVTALIGGNKTFESMEDAIITAEESINILAWSFNLEMGLHSSKAIKMLKRNRLRGVHIENTWGYLLLVMSKSVKIRIILSDFDPFGNTYRHQLAWATYRKLVQLSRIIKNDNNKGIEVICSMHDERFTIPLLGWMPDIIQNSLNPLIGSIFTKQYVNKLKKYSSPNTPLLWRFFNKENRAFSVEQLYDSNSLVLYPGTLHEKMCIIDAKTAFCGGIDVVLGRDRNSWHDVHCQVKGQIVNDFVNIFNKRWKEELPKFQSRLLTLNNEKPDFQ